MDNRVKLKRFRSLDMLWPRAMCVTMVLALSCLAGCEHRMSLAQFLSIHGDRVQAPPEGPPEGIDIAQKIQQSLGPYRVGPGDVLTVTVTMASPQAMTAVPVQVRVMSDGTVELPLAGGANVGDKTLEKAEIAIREAYVPDYYAQASVHVQVAEAATVNVLVVGAAPTPGLVALARNERNLMFAVARASGASGTGAMTAPAWASGRVTLRRVDDPTSETTVDLHTTEGIQMALSMDPLTDGDIVIIDSAGTSTLFVGGLVNMVGPQTYYDGAEITILQALAAAGGLRTDLFPHEGTLVRRIDGKDVHVKLDLNRLATGKDPNIVLASGDILWVPHTFDTRLHEFIQNTVYLRVGAGAYYGASYRDLGSKRYGDEKDTDSTTVVFP